MKQYYWKCTRGWIILVHTFWYLPTTVQNLSPLSQYSTYIIRPHSFIISLWQNILHEISTKNSLPTRKLHESHAKSSCRMKCWTHHANNRTINLKTWPNNIIHIWFTSKLLNQAKSFVVKNPMYFEAQKVLSKIHGVEIKMHFILREVCKILKITMS